MPGIVVGFDCSENAVFALNWALERAVKDKTPLTVLTINEVAVSPWTGDPSIMPEDAVMLGKAREAAEEAVKTASARFPESALPEISVIVKNGFAGPELVEASHGADMLVIGSAGQRGFPALRMSSVAIKVLHYSDCPVVVIPPAA
jgi:nucleotide-binding universal stress UspA family protein